MGTRTERAGCPLLPPLPSALCHPGTPPASLSWQPGIGTCYLVYTCTALQKRYVRQWPFFFFFYQGRLPTPEFRGNKQGHSISIHTRYGEERWKMKLGRNDNIISISTAASISRWLLWAMQVPNKRHWAHHLAPTTSRMLLFFFLILAYCVRRMLPDSCFESCEAHAASI